MNQELMKEFKADLKEFREMTEKFYAKEVSVKDYKGFSGGFGSYAQKGGEASMLRLRMPGGRVTKEKLKFLVDSIERYDVKRAHITTCQTVQFHDLDAKAVCDIMELALLLEEAVEISQEILWSLPSLGWNRGNISMYFLMRKKREII